MAERNRGAKGAQKSDKGFTQEERAAMIERVKELKATPRAGKADGERDVLAKIAQMPEPYRAMGKRLHAVIMANGPSLSPRTWYGMPAYSKDGDVVCFFRGGEKFKERYMTLGFNDVANLDEGQLWPVAFALTGVTAAEEARVASLVRKAVG
jgi:hypothetical protein